MRISGSEAEDEGRERRGEGRGEKSIREGE